MTNTPDEACPSRHMARQPHPCSSNHALQAALEAFPCWHVELQHTQQPLPSSADTHTLAFAPACHSAGSACTWELLCSTSTSSLQAKGCCALCQSSKQTLKSLHDAPAVVKQHTQMQASTVLPQQALSATAVAHCSLSGRPLYAPAMLPGLLQQVGPSQRRTFWCTPTECSAVPAKP